jgi:signal transduction histidine kinase
MIVAFAAVALLGTGSVFASPPAPSPGALETDNFAYLSERASMLLAEIKTQTAELGPDADTLGTFARNPHFSWQSHAFYLDRVRGHINAIGERTAELQQIRYAVLPWQEQAITEVTSHAAQVAASTQAAIVYLNENQGRRFVPEYRDHLTTIADSSEDMEQAVDRFLDYEKTQQKLRDLQNELDLGG